MPHRFTVRLLALLTSAVVLATGCTSFGSPTAIKSSRALDSGSAVTIDPGDTPIVGGAGSGEATVFGVAMPDSSGAFGWQPTDGGSAGPGDVETGTLFVPIDYNDPSKGTFELYVARHRANKPDQRIGTLLVDPGGPGFGASGLAINADNIYSTDLLDHFDIVGWDPRGTGETSRPINCIDDYDRYFAEIDITPDTAEERQQIIDLAREFEQACANNNAEVIQYIGTNNSARDMDALRRALGEERISFFGWSYGSELGATWATLFPTTVRAAVLDGAADPNAGYIQGSVQQSAGLEQTLTTFLDQCSADDSCAFHNDGDTAAAFDALMLQLDENPAPSRPERPPVNRNVALMAVGEAMYSDQLWPDLERALRDAQQGDGTGLLDLYDQYYNRQADGTYDNSLEAFQTITCMDIGERLTVEEEDATVAQFSDVAPRLAPYTTGSYFCTFYPAPLEPRVTITGDGAPVILVVGTTGDGITPLASSEQMAKTLEHGVLLTIVGNQHTGYGINQCSYETIDSYLIDLAIPAEGTNCD